MRPDQPSQPMSSRYRFHTRLSQRQRTSIRLRYMGGAALLASAIGLQVFLLGNLGDAEPVLAANLDENAVPSYKVDLSGNPDGVFVSPPMVRSGNTCNAGPTERCLSFTVLLDRDAEGLVLEQIAGEKPIGPTLYYVDCDKAAQLGESICIPKHNGKVNVSYCAPGTETSVYRIVSVSKVRMKADTAGTVGHPLQLRVAGLDPATVKWTSVFPGTAGSFDKYFTAKQSDGSVTMTPDSIAPDKLKFQISGTHKNACGDDIAYVDTVDVTLYKNLMAAATPNNAVCAKGGVVVLQAKGLGGKAPYTFTWKNAQGTVVGNNAECSVTNAGVYAVEITDAKKTTVKQTVTVSPAKVELPTNIQVKEVKQENALVAWQTTPKAQRYAVRVRAKGSFDWTYRKAEAFEPVVRLKDLQPGQTYEMQVMAYASSNAADSSGWSAVQTFNTDGPCVNANNLRYKIKSGAAWFYWTENPYCTRQELVVKKKGSADWDRKYKLGKTVNSVVVDNLKPGVEYEWAIKSYCPAGNYNGVREFTISDTAPVSLSNSAAASAQL